MLGEMTPHYYLLSKGWLYIEAVYPYRDPQHKLSTYTLQDALEIQRERDSIDWGILDHVGGYITEISYAL